MNNAYSHRSKILENFGVKSWINACNWSTTLGGTHLSEKVMAAMNEVGNTFVKMDELLMACTEKIAKLAKADVAWITSGAAAATTIAVAACIAGKDRVKQAKLPFTDGMKNEVVIQRHMVTHYSPQITAAGGKIVEYGWGNPRIIPLQMLEDAINNNTCCLAHIHSYHCSPRAWLPFEDVAKVAKEHDLPSWVDSASILPPVSNLWMFGKAGISISIFSGGKGIRGPNDTGILLGHGDKGKHIIESIRMFHSPNVGFARGFKVSKEQIIGLTVAFEEFVENGDSWYKDQLEIAKYIEDNLGSIKKLDVKIIPNDGKLNEHPVMAKVPRVLLEWDKDELRCTSNDIEEFMAAENPPIALRGPQF
jgi:L-seryl-tRNA(Ser) seleniumtransferase